MTDLVTHRLGHVSLTPDGPVVAGSMNEWTLTYTVGSYGIDEGGTLKLARRFASDGAHPQFDEPTAPNYTTVTTTGEAKLRPRYDPKAHVRPWMKCLVIDVYDGCLAPGDTVTITLGDRSQGSPGIRAQSFIESAHELRFLVDPTNACLVERLPSSPVLAIISGAPLSVVVIVPTQVVVGEQAQIFVKGEDRWGNPTPAPDPVELSWDGDGEVQINAGVLRCATSCSGRVVARWHDQTFVSNPITATQTPPQHRKYWGDLHAQSDATVGTGTEVEYFEFGRDWAHLDVMCHQGNDFQMTDEDWRRLNEVVRRFHQDGRFVVFPGYEWSANTAAGGDRNVMYLEEGMPIMRSSHWQIPGTPEDQHTPAHPADVLFSKLREHVDLDKVVLAAHCGGRYADIREYFDEELGPLIEVMSCWGVFEWLLWDAFDKGYEVGVVANSDGHKGRPGAEGPGAGQFGIFGGLTCMLAESLTRAAVFNALKQRRCYGTTGPRMDLNFEVEGRVMGSSFAVDRDRVQVTASVVGVGPIESLQLFRGRELIHEVRPAAFTNCGASRRIRLVWGGARIRGRGRRATWDGVVEIEGAHIERAQVFAFDSPMDGIQAQTDTTIELRSRTTGDLDGLDIWLDQAQRGRVVFRSGVGELAAMLGTLDANGQSASFGGLDLRASICRYPESPSERALEFTHEVELAASATTPLFVKAVQVDGHTAWSSPIYLRRC
ncbi:hypothetical protein DB30_05389 [Enhygromyxa salina]|uniref:DUF3604 domain-containing protein n=1 Tax=Enhygromyxa salina TaxID=215803 RepID=A0A0C2CX93_9BACT|nr:DUF3604 domain-containing protein [Enhygromyxa salina]KIG15641.1 hypothetical protein DB30_05389 [Enhygromyxa salina]